ncbi:MAG: hypothetical protein V1872_03080 [bacterium]
MFKVTINNFDKTLYIGIAKSVVLPSTEGELAVLDFHQPIICRLTKGTIQIEHKWSIKVKDGLVSFSGDKLEAIVEI